MAMNPRLRISGAFSEIASATFFLTVPLLVLSSILLGLVYTKRVTHGKSAAAFQSSTAAEEPGVFYVNYSATKLALVASWSGSIAPLLPVFLMTLLSFQIAARIGRLSSRADLPNLPTPYQLCLLLGFYTGSLSSLWRWMKHIVSKPR